MKLRKLCFIFSLLLLVNIAFAGNERGNGGDVVVCRNDNGEISSVELLDYYEGRILRGHVLIPGNNSSIDELSALLVSMIKQHSRSLAAYLKEGIENFNNNSSFLEDTVLPDISDSEHLIVPNGCSVEQIAVQIHDDYKFPGDNKYLIDKKLWDAVTDFNKFGLILHELIYKLAIDQKQKNSINTRYLTSMLTMYLVNGLTLDVHQYLELLHNAKLDASTDPVENLTVKIDNIEYYLIKEQLKFFKNGKLAFGIVKTGSINTNHGNIKLQKQSEVHFFNDGSYKNLSFIDQQVNFDSIKGFAEAIYFFPSGNIKSIYFNRDTDGGEYIKGEMYLDRLANIKFYDSMQMYTYNKYGSRDYFLNITGKNQFKKMTLLCDPSFSSSQNVYFYENGRIKMGRGCEFSDYRYISDTQEYIIENGSHPAWYIDGSLKSVYMYSDFTFHIKGKTYEICGDNNMTSFYNTGEFKAGKLCRDITVKVGGRNFMLKAGEYIGVHKTGKIKMLYVEYGFLNSKLKLKSEGNVITIPDGRYINLFENGKISQINFRNNWEGDDVCLLKDGVAFSFKYDVEIASFFSNGNIRTVEFNKTKVVQGFGPANEVIFSIEGELIGVNVNYLKKYISKQDLLVEIIGTIYLYPDKSLHKIKLKKDYMLLTTMSNNERELFKAGEYVELSRDGLVIEK